MQPGWTQRAPRRAVGAWLFVYALFALCAVLGILQYRAITEVSIAARERLRSSLEASLIAFSQDFNGEISSAAHTLAPSAPENAEAARSFVAERYERGQQTAFRRQLFARIAMAEPGKDGVKLLVFDPAQGLWTPTAWPAGWSGMRSRFEAEPPHDGRGGGPSAEAMRNEGSAFEMPLFGAGSAGFPRRGFGNGRGRGRPSPPPAPGREAAWLIFEVSIPYARETLLPEMLQRHLGADYQAEVVTRTTPRQVIYQSDADAAANFEQTADASLSLFDPQGEGEFRRAGPERGPMEMHGRHGPGGPGPGRGASPETGRWLIFVRHRAGSLEAAVAQARRRSMAVTAGVLLMLAATLAALIRYTRRAQNLAELQMEFVAGVSHELRTPVTVIHTAAHNLRGKVAANPAQVERYGALIQRESGRLKELVEQVLRFAGSNAGHAIQEREPLEVGPLVDEAVAASGPMTESAGCVVEKRVDGDLPMVWGDRVALQQAVQNLLANAAKYGSGESRWIGITASAAGTPEQPAVEIRVADRGRGIPADEQKHIFDPFFRGARAIEEQVHGTGLGLSLVKRIIEAHGGSIGLKSAPGKGAEFLVRLPAVASPLAEEAGAPAGPEPPGAAE